MVETMVFPVVTYSCESWTVKKVEHQRIDAFELWCWRRHLRIPWTARSNQSILREINPEYSLERLMLKLELQFSGPLMQTADSLEKSLMLGKIEGRRRRGHQSQSVSHGWHDWCNGHELGKTSRDAAWHAANHGVRKSWTRLGNWTTAAMYMYVYVCVYMCIYVYVCLCMSMYMC